MEENQELFEKIEAYLDGNLKADELRNFEGQMAVDQNLKIEVNLHRQLKTELDDLETLEFQEKLVKINAQVKEENKEPTSKPFNWYAIAATLTGILISSLVLYFYINTSTDKIFDHYYKPYISQNVSRGENNSREYSESFRLYNNQQYAQAISGFESLVTSSSNTDQQALLYLGNCYINTENFQMAISTFLKVEEESNFYGPSLWYLALSYLKQGDKNSAIDSLNRLLDKHSIYDRPAKELLKELTN